MFNEATFRDMGEMAGRSISRKVVSLSILVHDMINIIFMISRLCIQKISKFSSFSTVLLREVIDSHPKNSKSDLSTKMTPSPESLKNLSNFSPCTLQNSVTLLQNSKLSQYL